MDKTCHKFEEQDNWNHWTLAFIIAFVSERQSGMPTVLKTSFLWAMFGWITLAPSHLVTYQCLKETAYDFLCYQTDRTHFESTAHISQLDYAWLTAFQLGPSLSNRRIKGIQAMSLSSWGTCTPCRNTTLLWTVKQALTSTIRKKLWSLTKALGSLSYLSDN